MHKDVSMGSNANELFVSLLPLIVLFAVFYFFLIRPQRVQAKRHKEMLEGLKKGDKVISSGGFICEIIKVEEQFFSVRLSDESTARLSRDFVAYKYDDTQATQS